MKKIISIFCIIAMILSLGTVAFASETNPSMTVAVNADEGVDVKAVGAEFDVVVSYAGVPNLTYTNGNNQTSITGIQFSLAMPDGYTLNSPDPTYIDEDEFILNAAIGSVAVSASYVDEVFYYGMSPSTKTTYIRDAERELISIPVKCTAVPTEDVVFELTTPKIMVACFANGTKDTSKSPTYSLENSNLTVASATIKAGSTEVTYPSLSEDTFTEGEEVFDGYTATAAATGITVFQKTAEDLAAESYGIQVVTGGKTYKFPGKVAITLGEATEKIWGIKIVAPSGTFSDGTTAFAPTSVKAYVGSTLSDELVK